MSTDTFLRRGSNAALVPPNKGDITYANRSGNEAVTSVAKRSSRRLIAYAILHGTITEFLGGAAAR